MFHVDAETIRAEVAKLSTEELKKFLYIDEEDCDDEYEEEDDDDDCAVSARASIRRQMSAEDDEENCDYECHLSDLKLLANGISQTGFCPSLDLLSDAVKEFCTRTAGIWAQYRAEALRRYVSENIVPIAVWGDWIQLPSQKYHTDNVRCFAGTTKTVLEVSCFHRRVKSYRWVVNTGYTGHLSGQCRTLEEAQQAATAAFDNRIAAILRGEG